ncbi:hypothetical protein [Fluviicola sp.]|jgi:hypothetical protein|uniref:hypothetical protein n=1 Tax=Fluviicola sp. TaxID=1917219 RepID=UPI002826BA3C|nr:hypothetical protein [Fluviicola sp.]MDR0803317.1 hypothetical protein [Fluviicola sp.]
MKGKAILFFLGFCLMLSACKKEIGKKEYTMTFRFESGDEISLTGKIFEKYKKNKKYLSEIDGGYSLKMIKEMRGLYLEFSNKVNKKANNTTIALKVSDKKLIWNDDWRFWLENPTMFANNNSGSFTGDVEMEGTYTQKGRAYTVENGDFKFYWRNADEDFGMNDTILKDKWTLKRS